MAFIHCQPDITAFPIEIPIRAVIHQIEVILHFEDFCVLSHDEINVLGLPVQAVSGGSVAGPAIFAARPDKLSEIHVPFVIFFEYMRENVFPQKTQFLCRTHVSDRIISLKTSRAVLPCLFL